MQRETALASALAGILLVGALALVVVPGALASPTDDPSSQGHVGVADVDVRPGEVSGATATIHVDTRVSHRGPPTENVSVAVRAVDEDTAFVADRDRVTLGQLSDRREATATATLSVERAGSYAIEVVLYRDGQRVSTRSATIANLEALTPEYADSPVEFHEFDRSVGALPTVAYSVADVSDGDATLNVSAYLTNRGDERSSDLEVVYVARQVDSNIVADRARVQVGPVDPGRSATPSAHLTVPDRYNYYIVALLMDDGVIVDVAQSGATLDPDGVTPSNPDDAEDSIAEEFEDDGGPTRTTTEADYGDSGGAGGTPGFGPLVALLAIVAMTVLAWRVRDE